MQYRQFGRTGWQVSEIAFGAWQLGGDWGAVQIYINVRFCSKCCQAILRAFVEGCTQLRNQRLAVSRMAAGLRLVVYESASTARQGASGAWAGSSA